VRAVLAVIQLLLFPAFEAALAFEHWLDRARGRDRRSPARGWLLRQIGASRCQFLCRFLPKDQRWPAIGDNDGKPICEHCSRAMADHDFDPGKPESG